MARQIQTDMSFAFCEGSGPVCVAKTMADSDQRSPNKTKNWLIGCLVDWVSDWCLIG